MNQKQAQQYEEQLNTQLFQLANNLSMQLAIPLLEGPLDINFATDCVNAVIGGLNPKWKKVTFPIKSEEDIESAWLKLVKIVQSAFLSEQEKILNDGEDFGIENVVMLYEVLSQGCEALRQENLSPLMNQKSNQNKKQTKQQKNIKKQQKNPKKQQNNTKKQQKKVVKNSDKKKENEKEKEIHKKETNKKITVEKSKQQQNCQQKSKSKSKSKQKSRPKQKSVEKSKQKPIKTQKQRPKTSKVVNQQVKALQQQIIQNVTKTMNKKYLTKQQPKRQAKIREKQGTEAVQKAKRTFDYAVKDFQVSNRLNFQKHQKSQNPQKKSVADFAYMKTIQTKHKNLNSEIQNQQLKYYLQLRDKKVAYIRHIHKLIQNLEKERQRDFNKKMREIQIVKKQQIIKRIENVDSLFRTNMEKLQQNYDKRKKVQQMQNVGEVEVCRAMERQIKNKKLKQIQDIKCLWQEERNQLCRITGDEEKMKNKLIQIYRKYRV